ncbi:MAG: glycoside hydrolase family 18 protein [Candidatus Acidiferrum sp.]
MNSAKLFCAVGLLLAFPLLGQEPAAPGEQGRAEGPKVVGYFPQWGLYGGYVFGGYFVKNVITTGSATRLTHLNYAFANVVNNQCASLDTYADYQDSLPADETVDGIADSTAPNAFAGNFHQLQELKKRYPDLRIVMSIGGGSADPTAFSIAAEPANREAFVKSCIDMYIRGNFAPGIHEPGIFDGIDIDWEFPASTADETNFTALLREFRKQLDEIHPGMTLSIAAPAGSWAYQFIDLNEIQHIVSYFNLMTYDFDGPWNYTTGFVAPLYQATLDPDPTNNANYAVESYLGMGVAPEKIVFGVPFYGYEWGVVPNVNHGLFEPGTPENEGAEYNYIMTVDSTFTKYRDPITQAPWLFDGSNFWTYDDPVELAFKMNYVDKHKLGGVMIWEITGDMPDGLLLKTLVRGLHQAPWLD